MLQEFDEFPEEVQQPAEHSLLQCCSPICLNREPDGNIPLIPHCAPDATVPDHPADDYLKQAMVKQLADGEAVFDLAVQFQTDPYHMPIEDPGVTWDEAESPFHRVATLRIPSQAFDTAERAEFGDNLSFNPWRCLRGTPAAPAVSVAREGRYIRRSQKFRHERNPGPQAEPDAFNG